MRKPANLFSLWHYLRLWILLILKEFLINHNQKLSPNKVSTAAWAQAYQESPLAFYLHVSQQYTFQNLALCLPIASTGWIPEGMVQCQVDMQKARIFFRDLNSLYLLNTSKAEFHNRQNIALLLENTVLYKAAVYTFYMSNATTSCSKEKRSFWNKTQQKTFGVASRCEVCFDTSKYTWQ